MFNRPSLNRRVSDDREPEQEASTMAHLLYKGRLITAFARFDEDTKFWIPMADITWRSNRQRALHTVTGPLDPFENWPAAERCMTKMAKAWIDDHL